MGRKMRVTSAKSEGNFDAAASYVDDGRLSMSTTPATVADGGQRMNDNTAFDFGMKRASVANNRQSHSKTRTKRRHREFSILRMLRVKMFSSHDKMPV